MSCHHRDAERINHRIMWCAVCHKYVKNIRSPRGPVNNRDKGGKFVSVMEWTKEQRAILRKLKPMTVPIPKTK